MSHPLSALRRRIRTAMRGTGMTSSNVCIHSTATRIAYWRDRSCINRRLLNEALLAIETAVSAAADRAATASLRQTETARQIAADLITRAREWSADRLNGVAREASATMIGNSPISWPGSIGRAAPPCSPRSPPSASPFSSSRVTGQVGGVVRPSGDWRSDAPVRL